jgi:hypothetical protein
MCSAPAEHVENLDERHLQIGGPILYGSILPQSVEVLVDNLLALYQPGGLSPTPGRPMLASVLLTSSYNSYLPANYNTD